MNENFNLIKILKDCPEGTKFWSDNFGLVEFVSIEKNLDRPIIVRRSDGYNVSYSKEGWCNINFPASCLLWPSKNCRDWSKFTSPWFKSNTSIVKEEKFDPKTLKAFDRVLVRYTAGSKWKCDLFSDMNGFIDYPYHCISGYYECCIPYNDDTKYLLGTKNKAPEFYRYWED